MQLAIIVHLDSIGEYDTEFKRNNGSKKFSNTNPKNKKFDKIDLARAINCWEQVPYITCQGREKNFSYFNDVVKNQMTSPDEQYFKNAYATVVLYRKLDKMAKKMNLSYKSNVVAHTLGLMSYIYDKQIDLNDIWERKDFSPALNDIAVKLLTAVHSVIVNPPAECPEARMWAKQNVRIKPFQYHDLALFFYQSHEFYISFFRRPGNKFRVFRRSNQTIPLFLTLFRPKIGFPGCLCSCTVLRKRKKSENRDFSKKPMNKGFSTYSLHRVNLPATYSHFDTR